MAEIVVGIDGSEGSAAALRWAVAESGFRGWSVTAVMTWGYIDQHHPDGSTEFESGYTRDDAAAALDTFVTSALGEGADDAVERLLVNDLPARGLVEAAAGAQLLVLGARGLGGFKGLLLGSVSQACLHHATCPVAIVRSPERSPGVDDRIVVGIDESTIAQRALDWALDEARARQARLDVVHSWSPPALMGFSYGAEANLVAYERAARIILDGAVERADTSGLVHPVERLLGTSGAASSILEVAEGADLIVIGSRGRGGLKTILLGSVSHQVTQHADCTVVVIPTEP